jgi:hypothetical protein
MDAYPSDERDFSMRSSKLVRSAAVAGMALTLLAFTGTADAATWRVDRLPLLNGTSAATLKGVSAVTANDVWAVGSTNDGAVIDHWNGSGWSEVPSPAGACCTLNAVSAASASDVIAVGNDYPAPSPGVPGGPLPIAVRWNGSSWSRTAVPSGLQGESLNDVAALSPTDAWAVGVGTTSGTLALHWNGSAWSRVPSPNPATIDFRLRVNAVSGTSANDVWIVGGQRGPKRPGYSGTNLPYVLHWNGSAWTAVATPDIGSDYLVDVSAVSATNAWAVSFLGSVLHWDGTAWTVATKLSQGAISTVTAVSATDVWITGSGSDSLLFHTNGTTWDTSAKPAGADNLVGSASRGPGNVWFVGGYGPSVVVSTSNG